MSAQPFSWAGLETFLTVEVRLLLKTEAIK